MDAVQLIKWNVHLMELKLLIIEAIQSYRGVIELELYLVCYLLTYLLTNTMVAFNPLSCLFTCVCVCSIFYCVMWHNNCITSTRRLTTTTTTTTNQQQLQHRIIYRHGECRRHHCCTNITLLQCKATRIGTTLTCWITTMTILLIIIILLWCNECTWTAADASTSLWTTKWAEEEEEEE